MTQLHMRARNCIETLLEAVPGMRPRLAEAISAELAQLVSLGAKLEKMALPEEDVARIERLTATFLMEAGRAGFRPCFGQKRQ